MANVLVGRIEKIDQAQTIASKNGGKSLVKREFVIRALRFNPDDGTPELSDYNTPQLEIQGEDKVTVLDKFKVGDFVKCQFVVEGRSYEDQNHNVKYFNSVRATRVEPINVQVEAPQPQTAQPQGNVQAPTQSPFPPQTNEPQIF